VVVGGGIAGLAAAYEAARRGAEVTVLEASARPGGLIGTEHADGFTIETGPESMLAQKPAGIALCQELGLGDRLIVTRQPRTAYVLKTGRLYPIPFPSVLGIPLTWEGLRRYDLLPLMARARVALEPWVPARRETGDESVGSFFRRRFGAATVPLVAEPLLGGIHAGSVDRLSVQSLFPRLADAERQHGAVLPTLRRTPPSTNGAFRSLIGGMGELVDALARHLPPGALHLSAPAEAIVRTTAEWTVRAGGRTFAADAVVLAAPAHVAAALLRPLDPAAAAICEEVRYVSTAGVTLAFPRERVAHPLAGSGFVVARTFDSARITACTWISSKWPHRAPEGRVLLRAFLGGTHDPDTAGLPDEELVAIVCRDLARILGTSGEPLLTRVHRWRDAGAQHEVGHLERVSALERRLASLPGLFVAGSGYRPVGIPDCIADGRAAGAAAAALH
jgi:oxygen-dependent protoporphyrinogen oxidase